MSDANKTTSMISYPEVTSLKNYLYSGYLLREGYDIAAANVAVFRLVKIFFF